MAMMMRMILFAAAVMIAVGVLPGLAADIDRSMAHFKTPADIQRVRNPAGTNESGALFGDPSRPGFYVTRLGWLPGMPPSYIHAKLP